MRIGAFLLLGIGALCAACSSSPDDTSGTAGAGGGTTTAGPGGGGAGGSGGSGGGGAAGGTGGGQCAPGPTTYDNAGESGVPACDHPVAPLPDEDGTFAVTVFGPFAEPFELAGFTFAALDGENGAITDPWTAAVVVVPAGADPLAADPSAAAEPRALVPLETFAVAAGTVRRYAVQLDAAVPVSACESVVVALRNTVGSPSTALQMCGVGSRHPETNQWWNLDGTMSQMSSYGATFDRDWWVSLTPKPAN